MLQLRVCFTVFACGQELAQAMSYEERCKPLSVPVTVTPVPCQWPRCVKAELDLREELVNHRVQKKYLPFNSIILVKT